MEATNKETVAAPVAAPAAAPVAAPAATSIPAAGTPEFAAWAWENRGV